MPKYKIPYNITVVQQNGSVIVEAKCVEDAIEYVRDEADYLQLLDHTCGEETEVDVYEDQVNRVPDNSTEDVDIVIPYPDEEEQAHLES